jgi:hypothetical protein
MCAQLDNGECFILFYFSLQNNLRLMFERMANALFLISSHTFDFIMDIILATQI